jgi:hypothetical protein
MTMYFSNDNVPRVLIAALLLAVKVGHANNPMQFTDVTGQTEITFEHTNGGSGQFYLMEAVSAGLALFDYDTDGDIDIYFLNGAALKGTQYKHSP